MNWSGPNVIHFGRKSRFGPDQFILVVTISFWSWPNHYSQVQIKLVRPKPFWTNQNCFGHIEGQVIRIFYKIFIMISFSTGKLRKPLFLANKKFVFFFNCSNWEKFEGKIGENKIWRSMFWSHELAKIWMFFPLDRKNTKD